MTVLHDINQISALIKQVLQVRIVELEEERDNAIAYDFFSNAQEIQRGINEVEYSSHFIESMLNGLFIRELNKMELRVEQRDLITKPVLPDLSVPVTAHNVN